MNRLRERLSPENHTDFRKGMIPISNQLSRLSEGGVPVNSDVIGYNAY